MIRLAALLTTLVFFVVSSANAQDFGPLKGVAFGTGKKAVVVYLHGDVSRGGPAKYHFRFMSQVAAREAGATAIGLLRPGYDDGLGRVSPGNNHNRRDQYTQANADLIAETLGSIRSGWPDAKLIVLGHSGGAAQLGVVIAQNPGLVDTAILLSCPCHLKNWHDSHKDWNPNWSRSLSPADFIDQLTDATKIIAITGSDDKNTRPKLAEDYVAAVQKRGLPAELRIAEGGDHNGNFQLEKAFISAIREEIAN
ncbi:MAG: prolyl oligopeptidase family serine peptidase [Pseudomonadota bacterium]